MAINFMMLSHGLGLGLAFSDLGLGLEFCGLVNSEQYSLNNMK